MTHVYIASAGDLNYDDVDVIGVFSDARKAWQAITAMGTYAIKTGIVARYDLDNPEASVAYIRREDL